MSRIFQFFIVSMGLIASQANAQPVEVGVFFGFGYTLLPIGMKAACGGDVATDLSRVEALIAAYPHDAERADLQAHVDDIRELTGSESELDRVVQASLSPQQRERLCAAALPLNIEWMTPDTFRSSDRMPADQKEAWDNFIRTVESL